MAILLITHDRVVVAEFGWWEDCPALGRAGTAATGPLSSNINGILSDATRDPVSGSVPQRAVRCDVRPYAAANRGRWAGERSFAVAAARAEGRDVAALDLAPRDGRGTPAFRPGQHVVARLPGSPTKRSYSLIGSGSSSDVLKIAARRRASVDNFSNPSLSLRLHGLLPGDELLLEPPSGAFTPPIVGERPVVFLAAGIGITPFLSLRTGVEKVPG